MAMILGMGNPLLDISSEVDAAMLEKYDLQLNNALLAEDKHQPLFTEMAVLPTVQYIAGGATQNSIRVAQWMLQTPGATAYMGCVGDDDFAAAMRSACGKDGVQCAYMVDPSTPTGFFFATDRMPVCDPKTDRCDRCATNPRFARECLDSSPAISRSRFRSRSSGNRMFASSLF